VHRSWLRWTIALTVVVGLLAGTIVWLRQPVSPSASVLARVGRDAQRPCSSLEIIGLRGAGDQFVGTHRSGDDVYAFWLALRSALAGRAAPLPELYPLPYEQAPHVLGFPALIAHDITAGSGLLTRYATARRERCMATKIVVVGQSEGAAVVHWAYPAISHDVNAVLLFGDPMRFPGASYEQDLGARGVPTFGLLLALMDFNPRTGSFEDPIPSDSSLVRSYCLQGDPVCGFNTSYPGSHLSYRNDAHLLVSAASFVTRTIGE